MRHNTSHRNLLADGAASYGILLYDHRLKLFETYTDLLISWNRRMNLVSSRDINRFVEYHLLDSLKAASCVDLHSVKTVMDFGSGAGLPGIPLALAFPDMQVTLVESRLKRCQFLQHVIKEIPGLNALVMRSRAEHLPQSLNHSFDMVITRGTVTLNKFFTLASRFITHNGMLVAIKGENISAEFRDLKSICDPTLFHISSTTPKAYNGVRQGTVVVITNR